ncbi:MAG: hypothetical protein JRC68_03830 [Deltaproteobacteria bacterium]|nr:hypothetical protein [Deltaproteobacteria bacterium]
MKRAQGFDIYYLNPAPNKALDIDHCPVVFLNDMSAYARRRGKGLIVIKEDKRQSGVDKGLIAMFLKMSAEERLLANDNAVHTIQELRGAFRQRKTRKRRPKRTS